MVILNQRLKQDKRTVLVERRRRNNKHINRCSLFTTQDNYNFNHGRYERVEISTSVIEFY